MDFIIKQYPDIDGNLSNPNDTNSLGIWEAFKVWKHIDC